ncbi:hypothetical protein OEW28_18265 [Defluviimonas sp. WL0002]|uniref:Lipoprotein n=2 Tax=Albidovulum marisflavi TaxID=2984159 RepID=A0ABT2ZHR2_9RHOB|nr:hypothetical protein [Defluviimonas sp. WL0002]
MRGAMVAAAFLLAGCAASFYTRYDAPVAAEVSRNWRLADVRVTVPDELVVSEAKSLFPHADIVWREDPEGDRKAQVAAIVKNAATIAGRGLKGGQPVIIDISLARFHALTFEAETRLSNAGVHNIEFTAQVVDARTGAVLFGPKFIEAALPALAGQQMKDARARGETQRSQITAHLVETFRGWLNIGSDPRSEFQRLGG